MVKFCSQCGSLYNHNIDAQGKFIYHCQLCGNEDNVVDECIVINELNRTAHDYQINRNLIHDCSLPRTQHIKCPTCNKNTEIIIFQYNPDMLNVGYMCTECLNYWKN